MRSVGFWKAATLVAVALWPVSVEGQPSQCDRVGVPLEVARTLRIGTATGDERYAFAEIGDVAVTADGTIWILDTGAARLRGYDPEGTHRVSVGGEGEGPGEFRRPLHLSTSDSSITVVDAALHRETEYSLDGKLLRSDRLPSVPGLNVTYWWTISESRAIVETTPRLSYGSDHHEPRKIIAVVQHEGNSITGVDTLAAFHSGATIYHPPNSSLPWGAMSADFGPEGAIAVSPEGSIVVVDGYEGIATVLAGRRDGPLTAIAEIDLGLRGGVIDDADLDALTREFVETRESSIEGSLEFETPDRWSIATGALFGEDGALWVQNGFGEYCEELWTVIDVDTKHLERVRLPDGFRLRFLRDSRLYGTSRGPFGSPRVDVYSYTSPSPAGRFP